MALMQPPRPEQLIWQKDPSQGVLAKVEQSSFRGDHTLVTVKVCDLTLEICCPSFQASAEGAIGSLRVQGQCMAF